MKGRKKKIMVKLKSNYKIIGILLSVVLLFGLFISSNASAEFTTDVIPKMTGYTAPSGIVSASSETVTSSLAAWKAFNDIIFVAPTDCWATLAGQTTGWLAYEFPEPKIITKYTLAGQNNYLTRSPKDWSFQGWNETTSQWVYLDTQSNITGWQNNVRKEFTFTNTNPYKKYRINVTANAGASDYLCIAEMEMMETVATTPTVPLNLTGTPGDTQANLVWDNVSTATGYNVKRATTAGGQYTTIATNVTQAVYTDIGLTNGITYYYVVTAVNGIGESSNSNEVSVTPNGTLPPTANKALLVITMTNGTEKEYDFSPEEVNEFTAWYNNRAAGTGSPYYTITKNYNNGPFTSRKDNIVFDKILSFEINEY